MGSLSDAAENRVMSWLFSTDAVDRPTAWYVGLFTSDPTEDSASGAEVAGGPTGYARQPITFVAGAVAGTKKNSNYIQFPAALTDWGSITHAVVFDALDGGNRLGHAAVSDPATHADYPQRISAGKFFIIATGNLVLTID